MAKDSIEKSIENLTDDPDEFLENLGIVGGMSGLDFQNLNGYPMMSVKRAM